MVISAPLPPAAAQPSRLMALWHWFVGTAPSAPAVDEQLLLELERLAEVSPHLLVDLDFVQDSSGVFEPRLWRRGKVAVQIDADGTATAWLDG